MEPIAIDQHTEAVCLEGILDRNTLGLAKRFGEESGVTGVTFPFPLDQPFPQ